MGQNFRPVEPRFPHKIETREQKPTEPRNILTILNLRCGNMGTGEPSLSSSQPLSFSSSQWLWIEISDLLCFYTFSTLLLLAFWFSCQSTISLLFIIHLEFWAWLSTINTSKEPKERFGLFSHFRPLSQSVPDNWIRRMTLDYLCNYLFWVLTTSRPRLDSSLKCHLTNTNTCTRWD